MEEMQKNIFEVIKMCFMNFYSFIIALKLINYNKNRKNRKFFEIIFSSFLITSICEYLKQNLDVPYITIWNILLLSVIIITIALSFVFIIATYKESVNNRLLNDVNEYIYYRSFMVGSEGYNEEELMNTYIILIM